MSEPIHLPLNDYDERDRRGRTQERSGQRNADPDGDSRDEDSRLDARRPRGFDDLLDSPREAQELRPRAVEPLLPNFEAARNRMAQAARSAAPEQPRSLGAAAAGNREMPSRENGPRAGRNREYNERRTAGTTPPANLPESAVGDQRPQPPELPGAITAKNSVERALTHVRQWLPYAQKILVPLLEGNIATAMTQLLHTTATVPTAEQRPAPSTAALERSVSEVVAHHRELRGQMSEQAVQLKRVEDQLERVREATDRNTLEQQELMEDLRASNRRLRTVLIGAVALLLLLGGAQAYTLYVLSQAH